MVPLSGDDIAAIEATPADETQLPVIIRRNESFVREKFWTKLRRIAGRLPFAEDLVAAYYCALDRETPLAARAALLAALVYFIIPTDIIPDFFGAIGYGDDAAVLMAAISIVGRHMKPHHREQARTALLRDNTYTD